MKTYRELVEKDQYLTDDEIKMLKIGDKISYKKNNKGQKKTGVISQIKDSYVYINNGATAVDVFDILKK